VVPLHAAGLNPFDWKVADGALKDVVPHSFPLVLGSDGAGLVVKTGPGVTPFCEDDRVYGQFMRLPQGQGSYSEFTLAHQDGKLALLPDASTPSPPRCRPPGSRRTRRSRRRT
jgi:NADPH:quinone reductase-like Zn-dependent oxidoreductase